MVNSEAKQVSTYNGFLELKYIVTFQIICSFIFKLVRKWWVFFIINDLFLVMCEELRQWPQSLENPYGKKNFQNIKMLILVYILNTFLFLMQNEHDKIRELSQQLAVEKKRAATYKRHLDLIFEHIEEHNESLSKKIQHIVDSVKEIEGKEQQGYR